MFEELPTGQEFVTQVVDSALSHIQVDDPSDWRAKCPPPCDMKHTLTDVPSDHQDGGPIFVFQTLAREPDISTIGVIAYGRSDLIPGYEDRPLADRLNPPLQAMGFMAILSPEIEKTYAETVYNTPPEASRVDLPLVNDGTHLRVANDLSPDTVDLATIYLL